MQLDPTEFVLESAYFAEACIHVEVLTVGLLHDLINHPLGVVVSVQLSRAELDGDVEAVDEALIFGNVVGGWKVEADRVAEPFHLRRDQHHPGPPRPVPSLTRQSTRSSTHR
jgi:hypothetical protein